MLKFVSRNVYNSSCDLRAFTICTAPLASGGAFQELNMPEDDSEAEGRRVSARYVLLGLWTTLTLALGVFRGLAAESWGKSRSPFDTTYFLLAVAAHGYGQYLLSLRPKRVSLKDAVSTTRTLDVLISCTPAAGGLFLGRYLAL